MGQESNIRYTAVGVTDVGRVREHNEDNFLVVDLGSAQRGSSGQVFTGPVQQRGLSLVVADGMGGAAAGEVASKMAVDGLHDEFANADLGGTVRAEPDVIGLLETAINKANEGIFRKGQDSKEHQGMGTTLTASVILGDSLYLSQVGDSRGYLLRKGKLVQMTRDQSLIGQLIEEGTLTEEQAEKLGGKNIILQALGVEETLKIDSKRYEILRGDTLLLCSDGLSGMLTDPQMEEILTTEPDLAAAAKKLIAGANANGGKDNITVILARFEGEGLREPLQPLTDAEKTGGTFHAPPPPKSPAGRNAVIATAAILAVVAIVLFLPKPVKVNLKVEPVPASAEMAAAPEGGPDGFGAVTKTTEPGVPVTFELPRGHRFSMTVSAPGYAPETRVISTDTSLNETGETVVLQRIPAVSFDIIPPSWGGRPLPGIKSQPVPAEGQPVPDSVIVEHPKVEYAGKFPAGKWKLKLERAGFEPGESKEFDVPSDAKFTLTLDPLVEILGTITLKDAPNGAEVMLLDGEEPLLPAPERVNATRSTVAPLPARATDVTVVVTKPGHAEFRATVRVERDRATTVSLQDHRASVSFKGTPGYSVKLINRDRPGSPTNRDFNDEGSADMGRQLPGTYEVVLTSPSFEEDRRRLVLEAGEQVVDREVNTLEKWTQ